MSRRTLHATGTENAVLDNTQVAACQACAITYFVDRPMYVKLGIPGQETIFRNTHNSGRIACYKPCNPTNNTIPQTIIAVRGTASTYDLCTDISLLTATSALSSLDSDLLLMKNDIEAYAVSDTNNFILTGHSYGGLLSFETYAFNPGAIGLQTVRVITFNSFQFPTAKWTQAQTEYSAADHAKIQHFTMRNDFASMLLQTSINPVGHVDLFENDVDDPITVLPQSWDVYHNYLIHRLINFTAVYPEVGVTLLDDSPPAVTIDIMSRQEMQNDHYMQAPTKRPRSMHMQWYDAGQNDNTIRLSNMDIEHNDTGYYFESHLHFDIVGGCVATVDNKIIIPRKLVSDSLFPMDTYVRFRRVDGYTGWVGTVQLFNTTTQLWNYAHIGGLSHGTLPLDLPLRGNVDNMVLTDLWDVVDHGVEPLWDESLRRNMLDYATGQLGVFNTYVGSTPARVKFSNDIYSSYYGEQRLYWLTKSDNTFDYMAQDGQYSNPDVAPWTGQHVWEISLDSVPQFFDANHPFLGKVYRIRNLEHNRATDDLGEHLYFQGGHHSTFGGAPDNDDRFIEVLNEYPNETPKRVEVRIYCYRSGVLNYYDGSNDGSNPSYPLIDTHTAIGGYGHPIWYPITTSPTGPYNDSVWDMYLDPSDDQFQ